MIQITPAAAEQILRAATMQTAGDRICLRIAAKIEAGEIVYGMGFDEEREHDSVIESAGVTLLVAPLSQQILAGTTLDFIELRPGEFQFIFINPNESAGNACASRSSGCGSCGGGSTGGCG